MGREGDRMAQNRKLEPKWGVPIEGKGSQVWKVGSQMKEIDQISILRVTETKCISLLRQP